MTGSYKTLLAGLLLSSCTVKMTGPKDNAQQINTGAGQQKIAVNVNKYSSSKLVCDPFAPGPTTQTSYEKGIKAELYYLTSAMPRLYNSKDYVTFGQKAEQNLFFTDMNVPTRMFTEGFSNASGKALKNDAGVNLIEYFGLKMKTNLILTKTDVTGDYELALLSDDGTTLKLISGSGAEADEVLINNDGDHPTRMGCSSHTLRMRRNVMVPIEVTYYQGPRYHISNVLVWRKAATAGTDPLCNQSGNELFFNPNNNSVPQQAMVDLGNRGWTVVKPDNFVVSANKDDYNPCVKGTDPLIQDFKVGEVILSQVNFTWTTDIPATAQVQLTNMTTGEVSTTTSDNVLRTDNNVTVSNLQARTTYKAQAISVSADLGRSISAEVSFTTQ